MTSIQTLLALVRHFGIDPTELFTKAAEKVVVDASSKAVAAISRRMSGSVRAVFLQLVKRINDNFPDYLRRRLYEADQSQRPAIIEAAFSEWIQAHAHDAAELERLLFRIIYLRALVDCCSNLPIISGIEDRLKLDDVWVPQTVRTVRSNQPRQRHADNLTFETLSQAVASCGTPIVLTGVSGAGKSTQLRNFVLDQARWQLETTNFDQLLAEPLPIYLNAETLVQERADLTTALTHAIILEMGLRLPFAIPADFFDPRQPGAPRSLIIAIDGLDEISPERRDDLIYKIKNHGENFHIILASRTALAWPEFAQVELQEPSPAQADALIRRLSPSNANYHLVKSADLPRNPLVLTLAALLRRQKVSSRAILYQEFVIDRLMRSHELSLREVEVGFELLQAAANLDSTLAEHAERLTTELGLLPDGLHGLARTRKAKALLVSTGIIRQDGERLSFIHESFRSYLRSEALARAHQPQAAPWRAISPFRKGWEVVAFTIEIWRRDGQDITPAIEDLLAFGEPGLRMIAQIASRDAGLPLRLIDRAVAKWMHGGEDNWNPGYIDGPVQQLTLMAVHYESARAVLHTIARDEWTYSEDAAYAAQGLAKVGLEREAQALLATLSQNANAYCASRVLAAEILIEIGAETEARDCADELALEWANAPPDINLCWMYLAKAFHKLGRERKAIGILNSLDRELNDQLGLSFLAETYFALGKPRKAKAAARRAFNTREWSQDLWRGYNHKAMDMAALLDRVGAIKEAAFVRKNLKTLENQENEDLRAAATDPRRSAEDRLKCAHELLKRHDAFGLKALELLLSDAGIPQYERFSTVPELLAPSLRAATISTLKRVAMDEPWYRVQCGKALVLGGEPEEGCKILSQVAFEPAEPASNRADAIEQLVQSGRIDLAMAAFRRLRHSGDLKPYCLEQIADAFAHTSAWAEILDHCDNLLSSDDPTLRIEALNILVRAKRIKADSKLAENLLRHILFRRELAPDVRMKAARSLVEFEVETALDLVFDITTSPKETMEAGIEAMQFLYYRDEFLAIDGGHDVVWDKKLSLDQFIEAAHSFLSMVHYRHNSNCEPMAEEICGAIIEALQEIAADPAQPIERRFAAARVKDPSDNSDGLDEPFWPGVDAICQDEATPTRLRWPAIRYALHKDPARIEQWQTLLDGGEFSYLETAYLYLAADWRDEAAESFHRALAEETDLCIRVRIWKELVLLVEWPFAGREAAKALSEAVKLGAVECLKSELLEDLLMLSKAALPTDEFIELAKGVASHQDLNAYELEPAARTLVESGAATIISAILEERKISAQNRFQTDDMAFYELIHLHRLQAQLIKRDDAAKTLNDICSNPELGVSQRAFACRILSQIGRAGDARVRLRRLLTKATSLAEQLSIGRAAIDIHDWSLARQIFLFVAKSPSTTHTERVDCASGLAEVGFKKNAMNLLSSIDLIANDLVWQSGIEVLIACGQAERAVAICHDYIERADVCTLDKMEALGKLEGVASKEIARNLLVRLTSESDCDVSAGTRGAELLHSMGFETEARSILFRLSDQPMPDVRDALWLADTLIICALPLTAQKVLESINSESLDSDEQRHFREMKSHARYSYL